MVGGAYDEGIQGFPKRLSVKCKSFRFALSLSKGGSWLEEPTTSGFRGFPRGLSVKC